MFLNLFRRVDRFQTKQISEASYIILFLVSLMFSLLVAFQISCDPSGKCAMADELITVHRLRTTGLMLLNENATF